MMCEKHGADNDDSLVRCVLCGDDLRRQNEGDPVLSAFAKYIAWPTVLATIALLVMMVLLMLIL